jgi:hypothetical protein
MTLCLNHRRKVPSTEQMFPALLDLITVSYRSCSKKVCKFLNGICYCLPYFSGDRNIWLDMHSVDYKCTLCAVQSWINATYESITRENRHHIVPIVTFVFWGIDFTLIGEIEEKLRALPIANQIVESRVFEMIGGLPISIAS